MNQPVNIPVDSVSVIQDGVSWGNSLKAYVTPDLSITNGDTAFRYDVNILDTIKYGHPNEYGIDMLILDSLVGMKDISNATNSQKATFEYKYQSYPYAPTPTDSGFVDITSPKAQHGTFDVYIHNTDLSKSTDTNTICHFTGKW